jgi:superfamily II DNA/RNA helicase
MYDPFAQNIIEYLPVLDGLSSVSTQRVLSRAYFTIMKIKMERRDEGYELTENIVDDINLLRRLANALISRAIFDTDVEINERKASAFAAAEALSLLASLRDSISHRNEPVKRIERESVYPRLEAALLYLISGYTANAGGVINEIPGGLELVYENSFQQSEYGTSEWAVEIISRFCTFSMNPSPPLQCPINLSAETPPTLTALALDVRSRLFAQFGEATGNFMRWLIGEENDGLEIARGRFNYLVNKIAETQLSNGADIHHLARLMLIVLDETQSRSLVSNVPPPSPELSEAYLSYLKTRAKGSINGIGRPLMWPSTQKFVEDCLPGPNKNAVISMPTGSGKSFLAELAASQVIAADRGWVLYLAPTNALAHQIRYDLENDLSSFEPEIRAFIGGGEYTTLEGEQIDAVPSGSVVVMTPEKCSLGMRLNPQAFTNCSLCIFDECHLLTNKNRGITAEVVITQLMILAPECRFILMSAMVENAENLSDWLQQATGHESLPVLLEWRPTRSLRCVVGIEREKVFQQGEFARERLSIKNDYFKNEKFESPYALLVGFRGAWQTNELLDYGYGELPVSGLLRQHRSQRNGDWEWRIEAISWVNETARRLSEMLAEANVSTLVFLPRNKNYSFLVGGKVTLSENLLSELAPLSDICRSYLLLAEDELGLPSKVAELIYQGISVHTSLLLDTEKFASEQAFKEQSTIVMFATGTLAQGLNLPAIAVIIGGTQIGYTPDEDPDILRQRRLSQLINASGRAGRAGFANQGLVISIPDEMIYFIGAENFQRAKDELEYIQYPDAIIEVKSQLRMVLDSLAQGDLDQNTASKAELQIISILAGGKEDAPSMSDTIRRTYATFLREQEGEPDISEIGETRLQDIRNSFLEVNKVPAWITIAAQKAGLSFLTTLHLYFALKRVMIELPEEASNWSSHQWLEVCIQILRLLTPTTILREFGQRNLEKFSPVLNEIINNTPWHQQDNSNWDPPEKWISEWNNLRSAIYHWMEGNTILEIAAQFLALEVDNITNRRDRGGEPIPKTLGFVEDFIDKVAYLVGGILAIVEEETSASTAGENGGNNQTPYTLITLPLAIKYGCSTPQILAWYRFGIRLRRPAHLLNQAFPIDPELVDDRILSETITTTRNQWLRGTIAVSEELQNEKSEIFEAIKRIFSR